MDVENFRSVRRYYYLIGNRPQVDTWIPGRSGGILNITLDSLDRHLGNSSHNKTNKMTLTLSAIGYLSISSNWWPVTRISTDILIYVTVGIFCICFEFSKVFKILENTRYIFQNLTKIIHNSGHITKKTWYDEIIISNMAHIQRRRRQNFEILPIANDTLTPNIKWWPLQIMFSTKINFLSTIILVYAW